MMHVSFGLVARKGAAVLLSATLLLMLCLVPAQANPAADGGTRIAAEQTAPVQVAAAEQATAPAVQTATATPDVEPVSTDNHPWWFWPVTLLFFCFVLGIIAVMAGVGGGVLFVPLVSGFFPFHLDFVRGAGLLVALAGALAAGPGLLRRNFANLRLALPVALIASACSIVGALLGLALPTNIVQTCLGVTILAISVLLLMSKNSVRPEVKMQDAVGMALGMNGVFLEPSTGEVVDWKTHRTLIGLLLFIIIGIMAGMFGLGRGLGQRPRAQPADGRAAQGQRGYVQVPALHYGYLGRMGLPESGLRHSADGRSLHRGPDARFRGWRAPAGRGQAQVHPLHGHLRAALLRRQGSAQGSGIG